MRKMKSLRICILLIACIWGASQLILANEIEKNVDSTYANDQADSELEEQLILNATGLTETIVPLSDDDIETYLVSGDSFTEKTMGAWKEVKEEAGAFIEIMNTDLIQSGEEYFVIQMVEFERTNLGFIYFFNESAGFHDFTINSTMPEEYSDVEKLQWLASQYESELIDIELEIFEIEERLDSLNDRKNTVLSLIKALQNN